MRFFDPHIHMVSRTTPTTTRIWLQPALARSLSRHSGWGHRARRCRQLYRLFCNSGWLGALFRASQFGINHYCAIGVNSKEANNKGLAREALEVLPEFGT
ncbi:MAG: hypothetical protein ACFHHU_03335 [Porticoccaceae bacterium]